MSLARAVVLLGLCALPGGCASPVAELWPPSPEASVRHVVVSVDTWHAVIGFPRTEDSGLRTERRESPSSSQSSALSPQSFYYEEWGYAEQAWYLEGRQGVLGALRALFWPSAGVVEVGRHARPWSERTPDPPADRFRFSLSEEGYVRLRGFLEGSRRSEVPLRVGPARVFYPATRSYSVFHQCHQYAAHALHAGGLPVSPLWALTRSTFVAQLRRAEQIALDAAREASGASEAE